MVWRACWSNAMGTEPSSFPWMRSSDHSPSASKDTKSNQSETLLSSL